MEDPKELILPSALIVLGLFVFMIPGESDFEPLTAILPYLCSAPFMLAGCFILSKRMGAVEGPKLTLQIISFQQAILNTKRGKGQDQQSIGYMIMLGSAISAAVFWYWFDRPHFHCGNEFWGEFDDDFNAVFSFFWGLLKICFWTYVGSHVIIARPWQYFGEMGEENKSKRSAWFNVLHAMDNARTGCLRRTSTMSTCGEEFKA